MRDSFDFSILAKFISYIYSFALNTGTVYECMNIQTQRRNGKQSSKSEKAISDHLDKRLSHNYLTGSGSKMLSARSPL